LITAAVGPAPRPTAAVTQREAVDRRSPEADLRTCPSIDPLAATVGGWLRCSSRTRAKTLLHAFLCTNLWMTCVKQRRSCAQAGENAGDSGLDRAHDRSVNWKNTIHTLCMEKKLELSARHAAIAHE
jgi:hypothetical protein